MLTPEEVAEYLRQNPGFFEQNVDLLLDVRVAHPHGGRTVSIGERQLVAVREKSRLLEDKLRELIRFGEENDALSEKVHRMACRLLQASDLESVLDTVYLDLLDNFAVPHVAVRLWNVAEHEPEAKEFEQCSAQLRNFVEQMSAPFCGNHAVHASESWFGEAAAHLKSFALVALRHDKNCFGALALASEDAQRFYPEMGTLYLSRIGELLASALLHDLTPLRETDE